MNQAMNIKKVTLKALPEAQLGPGVRRRVVRGERLEFLIYAYRRGARFPVHAHPAEQLTIVLQGQLVLQGQDGQLIVNAGEAVFIPANEPHGASVPEDIEEEETVTYNIFTPVRAKLPEGR